MRRRFRTDFPVLPPLTAVRASVAAVGRPHKSISVAASPSLQVSESFLVRVCPSADTTMYLLRHPSYHSLSN